jgi:hypothetical protein
MTAPGVSAATSRQRSRAACTIAAALAAGAAAYLLAAYLGEPGRSPKVAHAADAVPGDPLNVGLVGHRPQVVQALLAAGWRPADAARLASSVEIVGSVLFHRPDATAPVSALYLFGRRQDLAFEREVGSSASRRHHVR